MFARTSSFVVWALVAASAAYWGAKLFAATPAAPAQAVVATATPPQQPELSRLFGPEVAPVIAQTPPEPAPDARFQLVGVVAPRGQEAARQGVALIAVDGRPAKAYRVGAVVDGSNVLQSVRTRGASLGPAGGTTLVALQLPALPAPNVGTLPVAGSTNVPAPPVAPAPMGARHRAPPLEPQQAEPPSETSVTPALSPAAPEVPITRQPPRPRQTMPELR